MQSLLPVAEKIAARLVEQRATIAIAESSTGGLVAAALLALLGIGDAEMQGMRPATEQYSLLIARRVRERHGATWGFGETGAAGPSGNRYGDAAGHTCMAIAGPIERAITLQTGSADRLANMDMFTERALALLVETISAKS